MKKTLVLLTLNEIAGLRQILPKIKSQLADEIVAVDGGSTDGTVELLESRGIRIIRQEKRGRGEAFRAAAAHTSGNLLVFFSPDGNEDAADIPRVFAELSGGADMAIASRFLPGARNEEDASWLPLRKWTNRTFSFIANLLWNRGPWITDTINGFRGLTREAWTRLLPESMGYTIEYEMTIRAMKQGMRIKEFPTIEGDRLGGRTKAPSFHTGLLFLRLLLREMLRRAR